MRKTLVLAVAVLVGAGPVAAQQADWGVAGGLTAYKRLALTVQGETSVWTGEYVRIGPLVRGFVFFEPFSMSCPIDVQPGDGGLCNNPIQAMASIGLRVTSESRSRGGLGIFAESAFLPMRFDEGSAYRWGAGAGLRYRSRVTLEVGAMAIPESNQVVDYLLFFGVGRNDAFASASDE